MYMHTEVFAVKREKATTAGKARFLFAGEISISGRMRVNGMLPQSMVSQILQVETCFNGKVEILTL